MITTLQFIYGFTYKNVNYGWKDKKLYKLPYLKYNRSYNLKEIPFYVFKATIVYNIQRQKLTINKLKLLTKKIDYKLEIVETNEIPF